jgi:hypothetical protein
MNSAEVKVLSAENLSRQPVMVLTQYLGLSTQN